MKLRLLGFFCLSALALLLGACGGSSDSSSVAGLAGGCPSDAASGHICLVSCNLGCSNATCGVSEVAVNQQLVMVFNRNVDPASVNPSTFSLITSSGKRPTGTFDVQNNVVYFNPSVVVTSNATSFGFDRGETYILNLPGAHMGRDTIRSTNGFPLWGGLLCTLTASQGVIDPNNAPPKAKLIVPTEKTGVPQDTLIVVEFDELLTMSTVTNPTSVDVYVSMGGGVPTLVQCERFAQSDPVTQRVHLTLRPSILLPSRSRVEVRVKGEIRDLSGKPCEPIVEVFEIQDTGSAPVELTERFQDTAMLDSSASGAPWGGGKLSFGTVGGSGLLGPFDKEMFVGVAQVGNTLNISTDSMRVKATHTLTGDEVLITNGVFEFETFNVPRGMVINFHGSNVPRVVVRGSSLIEGKVQVNGLNAASHDGGSLAQGQGGRSNCGGGAGGLGALRDGNGQHGSPVAFPAGSARFNSPAAQAAGGRGSAKFPGAVSTITYNGYDGWVCAQMAAGGSGGSNATAGTKGWATLTGSYNPIWVATDVPPDNPPGVPFPYMPKLATEKSVLQFLAGGSGGGGGGSGPVGSMKSYTVEWHTGAGGGGGGGALLLRTGGDVTITRDGVLEAAGGSSPNPQPYKRAVPGGGGSGGNILIQLGGRFLCQGKVWGPGGSGGAYEELASYNWGSRSVGGVGGFGYMRVEALVPPSPGELIGFQPPGTSDNVGKLEDHDDVTGVRSRFYQTRRLMPHFSHYIIEAEENGQPVLYSDDPRLGKVPNYDPRKGTAVSLFLQGAQVDSQGEPIGSTITKWVSSSAGLNELKNWYGGSATARPTSVRWILLFDRGVLSSPWTVEVKKVTIFCEG